jgi:hypothetical protein
MPGFFLQWDKYFKMPGLVVHSGINITYWHGSEWMICLNPEDSPRQGWAGHLKSSLRYIEQEFIILMLDDYWLTKQTDHIGLSSILRMMIDDPAVDKVDLTNDRIGFAHTDYDGNFVRSTQDAQYLTSTQAAIWRKSFLDQCLVEPAWNPWEFEIIGSQRAIAKPHKILGCKKPVIHYANVVLKGKHNQTEIDKISTEDQYQLAKLRIR